MAANKIIRIGPLPLTNTIGTSLLNPPTLTGGVGAGTVNTNTFYILRHIRIINKTGSNATFSLYIGAAAATTPGTEFEGLGSIVLPANFVDWYGQLRLDVADFLVGGSNLNNALVIEAEGEIGVA